MALSRDKLMWLIENRGANDWKNIRFITVEGYPPIFFHEFATPGQSGITFVNETINPSNIICGFLVYGMLALGNRRFANEKVEIFIDVTSINEIAFIRTDPPDYV